MTQQATASGAEARLKEMGLTLPKPAVPVASYVPWVRSGNLVFISGQIPSRDGTVLFTGKVGKEVSLEEAQEAARACALNGLAAMKNALDGDLGRIKRIVKLTGFVATAEGFTDVPKVINGCSDLMLELFGEAGKHSRSAVGVAELPLGVPVEIEFIIETD
jgi:enamine deaminase RidA (YjgF/YER057c/UK114 family)